MTKLFSVLTYLFIFTGIILLIAVVATLISEDRLRFEFAALDWDYASKVGDFSGFLSMIFSAAAVFSLFITLRIQQKQFEENKRQNQTQQFEGTFFNMMNVLFNIKESITYKFRDETIKGQQFFEFALTDLKVVHDQAYSRQPTIQSTIEEIRKNKKDIPDSKIEQLKAEMNEIYMKFYGTYHAELGHYFRYLFNLLKFVIASREKYKDEDLYINIVQAQLSNAELGLIFYNTLSNKGLTSEKKPKFYLILEKYQFLENIDSTSLLLREHHSLYPKTFFKFLNVDELAIRVK